MLNLWERARPRTPSYKAVGSAKNWRESLVSPINNENREDQLKF